MRFTVSAATLLAFVSAAVAQTAGFDAVLTPAKDEAVAAGSTYTITWDYTSTYAGTVSIQLLEGSTSTTLQLGPVIASGLDNSLGKYSWSVDSSLGADATYGLKITYDSDSSVFQYSNPFQISAASSAAATTPAAAATTAAPVVDDDVSSTVYSTEWLTITSCAATVTDCPARSTVVSSTVHAITPTSAAGAVSGAPSAPSAPAASPASSGGAASAALPKTTLAPIYPIGNSSTGSGGYAGQGGALGTVTLSTSTKGAGSSASASASASATGSVGTSGAGRVAAGSFALVAGVVAAVFAL